MQVYRISYVEVLHRVAIVRAESESAARQAWIDDDVDHDVIVKRKTRAGSVEKVRPVTAVDRLIDLEVEYGLTDDDDNWVSSSGRTITWPLENKPFVLIEQNPRHLHCWATNHATIAAAQEYHDTQESAGQWDVIKIVNLFDGRVWFPVQQTQTHWLEASNE